MSTTMTPSALGGVVSTTSSRAFRAPAGVAGSPRRPGGPGPSSRISTGASRRRSGSESGARPSDGEQVLFGQQLELKMRLRLTSGGLTVKWGSRWWRQSPINHAALHPRQGILRALFSSGPRRQRRSSAAHTGRSAAKSLLGDATDVSHASQHGVERLKVATGGVAMTAARSSCRCQAARQR